MSKLPKILFASYECAPFFKFGGLADVAGSLPKALKHLNVDIRVIMPYYTQIKENYPKIKKIKSNIKINIVQQEFIINLYQATLPNSKVIIYFIDCPQWFQVANIFAKPERTRFIIFSNLITEIIAQDIIKWQTDIIHCNDWQTALVPKLIKNKKIKTLLTIHNIGYAGRTNLSVLEKFGFTVDSFSGVKENKVNLLGEAILDVDKINTVSPTYAKEILTPAYGYDMVQVLKQRKKDLSGIINGLDFDIWDPATDKDIKFKFDINNLDKKIANKLYLQEISNLPPDKDIPVIGLVSRLAGQKGFDLIKEIFAELMQQNLQLIILGTGDQEYEKFFAEMNQQYPTKFKAHLKFDIKLAKQIYAGADMFLMPSKYEPCGLGQLIAMKYGTVPIVRATGGLKDTVEKLQITNYKLQKIIKLPISNIKTATGFSFNKYESQELLTTIQRALSIYQDQQIWQQLVENVIKKDFSWDASAKEYLKLYQELIK